ncbi:MAG: hypothetical protein MUC92_11090 [Fimbriimonadaceae bacterium]|jgi:hypothetical protein|nr:hypothetical protein [Fimbriimonadaceae bacterium]
MLGALCILAIALGQSAGSALEPAPAGSFTVAVIPDTQGYRGEGAKSTPDSREPVTNENFHAMTRFLAANKDSQRIVFASHVGDIVDINEPRQWGVAQKAMERLDGIIPYGISLGNHDMESNGDSSLFQSFFPAKRFEGLTWYVGSFPGQGKASVNNANSVQRFRAEGVSILFFHLECNAPDQVLRWVREVAQNYPDHKVMITTHMFLGPRLRPKDNAGFFADPKGRMEWSKIHGTSGNSPEALWQKLFSQIPQLVSVFCGDQSRTQALTEMYTGVHRNRVAIFLSDYGSDAIRLYRFIPTENRVEVRTVLTKTGSLLVSTPIVPDPSEHNFEVPIQLNPVPARRLQ